MSEPLDGVQLEQLAAVAVEQKTNGWAPIGTPNGEGAVTTEVFAGKGRRYRAEVDGVVQEKGKKFSKSKPVLTLRFKPPVAETEEPPAEGDV